MSKHLYTAILLSLFSGCQSGSSGTCECSGLGVLVPPSSDAAADTLGQEAQLDGRYAKGLTLQPVTVTGVGPGQMVVMTLKAAGMQGIGQFDLVLQPEPAAAFDMEASAFQPTPPFVTLRNGVEQQADGRVRLIGANLSRSSSGDAELGTLRLKTGPEFSGIQVLLRVVFFSIGPSSSERDNYEAGELRLGITINATQAPAPVQG